MPRNEKVPGAYIIQICSGDFLYCMNKKRWMEISMAVLLLCGFYWLSGEGARLVSKLGTEESPVVVVDAGHGGCLLRRMDGRRQR